MSYTTWRPILAWQSASAPHTLCTCPPPAQSCHHAHLSLPAWLGHLVASEVDGQIPRGNPATSWGLLSSAHCWWCHFSPLEESNSNACNSKIFSWNSVWDPNWYEVFKIYSKSLCANWNLWRWFDALWNSSPGDPYIVFQFLIIHIVD